VFLVPLLGNTNPSDCTKKHQQAPHIPIEVCECKYNIKDSASTQNISVAFYQEYSRNHYLYFTIGKQWNNDLLVNNKGVFTNIPT
jgi:hypothetical protein